MSLVEAKKFIHEEKIMLPGADFIPPEVVKLFLDFDRTIPQGHLHAAYQPNPPNSAGYQPIEVHAVLTGENAEQVVPDATRRQAILDIATKMLAYDKLNNPKEMCALIRSTLQAGKDVAIVSFTKYPAVIPIALRNMGLSPEEIKQIGIVGDYPGSDDIFDLKKGNPNHPDRKAEHLSKAMVMGKHRLDPKDPKNRKKGLLIDDDLKNVVRAEQMGYQSVFFSTMNPDPKDYIGKAYDILEIERPEELKIKPYVSNIKSGEGTPYESFTVEEEQAKLPPLTEESLSEAFARAKVRNPPLTPGIEKEKKPAEPSKEPIAEPVSEKAQRPKT